MRPRIAQIPGTESQIVKGNGDMPVIVKWGGLNKGLEHVPCVWPFPFFESCELSNHLHLKTTGLKASVEKNKPYS